MSYDFASRLVGFVTRLKELEDNLAATQKEVREMREAIVNAVDGQPPDQPASETPVYDEFRRGR